MDRTSQPLVTFQTRKGQYTYIRMHLDSRSPVFQKGMDSVSHGLLLTVVMMYGHYILVYSKSTEAYHVILNEVFDHVQGASFRVNRKKY